MQNIKPHSLEKIETFSQLNNLQNQITEQEVINHVAQLFVNFQVQPKQKEQKSCDYTDQNQKIFDYKKSRLNSELSISNLKRFEESSNFEKKQDEQTIQKSLTRGEVSQGNISKLTLPESNLKMSQHHFDQALKICKQILQGIQKYFKVLCDQNKIVDIQGERIFGIFYKDEDIEQKQIQVFQLARKLPIKSNLERYVFVGGGSVLGGKFKQPKKLPEGNLLKIDEKNENKVLVAGPTQQLAQMCGCSKETIQIFLSKLKLSIEHFCFKQRKQIIFNIGIGQLIFKPESIVEFKSINLTGDAEIERKQQLHKNVHKKLRLAQLQSSLKKELNQIDKIRNNYLQPLNVDENLFKSSKSFKQLAQTEILKGNISNLDKFIDKTDEISTKNTIDQHRLKNNSSISQKKRKNSFIKQNGEQLENTDQKLLFNTGNESRKSLILSDSNEKNNQTQSIEPIRLKRQDDLLSIVSNQFKGGLTKALVNGNNSFRFKQDSQAYLDRNLVYQGQLNKSFQSLRAIESKMLDQINKSTGKLSIKHQIVDDGGERNLIHYGAHSSSYHQLMKIKKAQNLSNIQKFDPNQLQTQTQSRSLEPTSRDLIIGDAFDRKQISENYHSKVWPRFLHSQGPFNIYDHAEKSGKLEQFNSTVELAEKNFEEAMHQVAQSKIKLKNSLQDQLLRHDIKNLNYKILESQNNKSLQEVIQHQSALSAQKKEEIIRAKQIYFKPHYGPEETLSVILQEKERKSEQRKHIKANLQMQIDFKNIRKQQERERETQMDQQNIQAQRNLLFDELRKRKQKDQQEKEALMYAWNKQLSQKQLKKKSESVFQ